MGGKTSSAQSSSSNAWGLDQSVAAGQSTSGSQGASQSTGQTAGGGTSIGSSMTGTDVWNPQGNALQGLYGQAQNFGNQNFNPYSQQYNAQNQQLQQQGQQAIQGLQGYNAQDQIDAQSNSLRTGIDHLIKGQLSDIGANASQMNAFGGSRHGLVEAAAMGEGARAYSEGLGDITARANQQGIMANQSIGQMLPQLQQMQGNTGAYDQQLQMSQLQSLAQAFGQGPTTLGYGNSNQASNQWNMGNNQSTSFNNSFADSLNYALSQGMSGSTQQGENNAQGWDVSNMFGTIF